MLKSECDDLVMCGRLSIAVSKEDLTKYLEQNYDITVLPDSIELPKFNIAPSEELVTLINDGTKYRVGLLKWGFVPEYTKDESKILINARSETVDKLYTFKKSLIERRCLIFADGFFEWSRSTGTKTPYRFVLKKTKVFALAGLWSSFINKQGKRVFTTTIITTKANSLMSEIHDRMPVILDQESAKIWLNPNLKDTDALKKILNPYDSNEMEIYQVSSKVNNPKNKNHEVIDEIKKST
ncbi:MAG: SOS response-associated peptidase [Candidatus Izemoplasmatales bacterium]